MNLFMPSKYKMKYIFLGDTNSINIELILKSHKFLKKKLNYIVICDKSEFYGYIKKINSKIIVNEILDPLKFTNYRESSINIFNIENKFKEKYKNLLSQLKLSNELCLATGFDLITMPIDKSIFKKNISFNGMTEYLGKINKRNTAMLMYGENFSVLPLTTHINLKYVHKSLRQSYLKKTLKNTLKLLKDKKYKLNFKSYKFLCYNPHCSENKTIGKEDYQISKLLNNNFSEISGPISADSAFNDVKVGTLFISTYHDQALIPFKILNKKGINFTIGLEYRRFSPAHGIAKDIKFKNKADATSYIQCMLS